MTRDNRDRVTIRAVAAYAGVSRQTVSNAINTPERLTDETLRRVRAAIEELGYRPDEAARALTSRRSRLIGIRIGQSTHEHPSAPEPLFSEFVRSAGRYGYRFVIFGSQSDDADQIASYEDLWSRRGADGFILTDTHRDDIRPRWLSEHGVPFVGFGRPWGSPASPHPWIDVDGRVGLRLAVEHVIGRGCSDIAYLGWASDGAGGDDRERGWADAVADRGQNGRAPAHAEADTIEAALGRSLPLLRDDPPDAIVCASDLLAVGAVHAAARLGMAVGHDILITGFDDSPSATHVFPQLTSLRQPFAEIADFLVDRVIHDSGGEVVEAPPRQLVVEPTLVIRGSTGGDAAG